MAKTERRRAGDIGEDIACTFLEQRGYKIVERNYQRPWGEIDIIAEKDGIVHFIEVKAVSRTFPPGASREIDYRPEEMVTQAKLRKVSRTAALYMESKRDPREYQLDVIGVIMDPDRKIARCRFFEQVVEGN